MATNSKETGESNEVVAFAKWFEEDLLANFKATVSRVFLIHGDINGLTSNPDREEDSEPSHISIKEFLKKIFDSSDMSIFYNIASGISFAEPEMEKEFRKLAGLESADTAGGNDPVAAAKAGLAAKRQIPKEPEAALPLIEKILKKKKRVSVIVNSSHLIAPSSGGSVSLSPVDRTNMERIKNWAEDSDIRNNGNIVILLADELLKVSSELRQSNNSIHQIYIPKPNAEERGDYIGTVIAKDTEINSDEKLPILVNATQGMSLRQISEIFLQAKCAGQKIDLDFIKSKKREILNAEYGEVMEIVEPERGLEDIGGLEHIKRYLKSTLEAIRRGETRLIPMGVMLMGPPGTGKTAIVEALAKEAGFNFVKTKNIRDKYVGESEARMQKMLNGLRALAPVVVMNDEADLAEASRDAPKGDSGVSERLMKMWMEFLSDPRIRGQVVVISCLNRPDRIDPALKRTGRADERMLLPMPMKEEIPDIFKVMFRRYKIETNIEDFSPFAGSVKGLSGADIEKVVRDSYRFAFEKSKTIVDKESLRESIEDFIPSNSQAEIDRWTLYGILECSSKRLLPPYIREIVKDIQDRNLVPGLPEILEQIRTRNIISAE